MLLSSLVAIALPATPDAAQAQQATTSNTKRSEPIEEVIVSGVRESLRKALDVKREANSIVDAISSEDIGVFPDENVAESLQRIPGIALTRERGEGSRLSIRGLGPEQNLTLVDGQRIASQQLFEGEQPSRSFNFALLASEVISSAEVYKSPEARIDEGGVGGTINLRLLRPLELRQTLATASLEGGYSDLADEYDPRYALNFGTKWGEDRWGAIISLARTERTIRNDAVGPLSFSQRPIDINSDGVLDFGTVPAGTPVAAMGPGIVAGQAITGRSAIVNGRNVVQGIVSPNGVFQPDLLANTFFVSERTRTGGSGSLQFRPSDQLQFTLNGLYSELTEEGVNNNFILIPQRAFQSVVTPVNNARVTASNTLVAGTIPQRITADGSNVINTALDSFDRDANIDTAYVDLATEWRPAGSPWKFSSHIGYTEANTDSTNRFIETVTFGSQTFDLDVGKNGLQDVSNDLLNPDGQFVGFASFIDLQQTQEEKHAQIDAEREFDNLGPITSLQFGVKYRDLDQDRAQTNSALRQNGDGRGVFSFGISDFNPRPVPGDFLTGGFRDGIQSFLVTSPDTVDKIFGAGFGSGSVFSPAPQDTLAFAISEESVAGYTQLNFKGASGFWRGNLGVRVVTLERDSNAFQVQGGVSTPFSRSDRETDTLPSANLIFDISDNYVLRLAAARTLARPTFGELSPALLVVQELRIADSGNPGLDPFVADQFDVSSELYFGTNSTLSAAVFYKDIKSFTVQSSSAETLTVNGETALFQVNRPSNGGGGEVFGFEVAYLQNFSFLPQPFDGLGVNLNYTYSDSNTQTRDPQTGSDLPLPGQSKDTVNASVFYEKGPLSTRLAFNYRSKFFNRVQNLNAVFIEETSQYDFNLTYRFTKSWSAFFEGINITDKDTPNAFAGTSDRILGQGRFGRRYFFGTRYKY
jgi:iron complex outermembrane receptor protein